MAMFRSGRDSQKYLLVQDSETNKKYPLYITMDAISPVASRKFRKVDWQVGDKVHVKGKVQKLVSKRAAGMKIVRESDLEHKDAGILAFANVVVPSEMSKVEAGA